MIKNGLLQFMHVNKFLYIKFVNIRVCELIVQKITPILNIIEFTWRSKREVVYEVVIWI